MLWLQDCAEIEIFSQGRTPFGAMLLPNDVIKHLELLSYRRRMVSPDEHILKIFKGEVNEEEEPSEPSE